MLYTGISPFGAGQPAGVTAPFDWVVPVLTDAFPMYIAM